MGLIDFLRKMTRKFVRQRKIWLRLVANGRSEKTRKRVPDHKELSDKGFIEGTITLSMFAEDASKRKALYKKAADQNHPEGLWGYAGFLQHSYIPNPKNPADAEWEIYCLRAAQNGSADAMSELGDIINRRKLFLQSVY